MKDLFKYIFCLLFLFGTLFIEAQQAEIIGIRIFKDFKEKAKKDRLEIGLLIRDTIGVASFNTNKSRLITLRDDTGKNLILNVDSKEQGFINGRNARIIDEGLILQIETNRIPNKEAKDIHINANLSYKIIDNNESLSTQINNMNFKTLDTLNWFDRKVKIYKNNYNDSRKGAMIWYKFKCDNFDLIIEKVEETNLKGEVIREIDFSRYSDYYQLSFKMSEINESKNLKITYKESKNMMVTLDQKFGIGL